MIFFKVALNPLDRLTLQNVSSCPSDYFSEIKNGGHLVFLRYTQLKTK